jgi:hypothetical protein
VRQGLNQSGKKHNGIVYMSVYLDCRTTSLDLLRLQKPKDENEYGGTLFVKRKCTYSR